MVCPICKSRCRKERLCTGASPSTPPALAHPSPELPPEVPLCIAPFKKRLPVQLFFYYIILSIFKAAGSAYRFSCELIWPKPNGNKSALESEVPFAKADPERRNRPSTHLCIFPCVFNYSLFQYILFSSDESRNSPTNLKPPQSPPMINLPHFGMSSFDGFLHRMFLPPPRPGVASMPHPAAVRPGRARSAAPLRADCLDGRLPPPQPAPG